MLCDMGQINLLLFFIKKNSGSFPGFLTSQFKVQPCALKSWDWSTFFSLAPIYVNQEKKIKTNISVQTNRYHFFPPAKLEL